MKKNKSLILVFLVGVSLLFTISLVAQPIRKVKKQVLSSNELPKINLKFDKKTKFIGSQKFTLYQRAEAEQFFFIEADVTGKLKRMYLVQFEGFLPNVEASYNYKEENLVSLGRENYIGQIVHIPNAPNVLKTVPPESDTAQIIKFVSQKGFSFGTNIVYQRLVRLVDEKKRNEIIIIYVEDTDKTTGISEEDKKGLTNRLLQGVKVLN